MNDSMIIFYEISIPLKDNSWFNSPVYATSLGFLLAFFTNFINDKIKEEKELKRYEYMILKITQDILKKDEKDIKAINAHIAEFRTDLRFAKLDSMKLIIDSLSKTLRGETDCSNEINGIDERLKKLGKRGIIDRVVSFFS